MKKEQIEKASYCPAYQETTILITVTVTPHSHLTSAEDKRHLLFIIEGLDEVVQISDVS